MPRRGRRRPGCDGYAGRVSARRWSRQCENTRPSHPACRRNRNRSRRRFRPPPVLRNSRPNASVGPSASACRMWVTHPASRSAGTIAFQMSISLLTPSTTATLARAAVRSAMTCSGRSIGLIGQARPATSAPHNAIWLAGHMRHQDRDGILHADAEAAEQVGGLANPANEHPIGDLHVLAGIIRIRQIMQRATVGPLPRGTLDQPERRCRRQERVKSGCLDGSDICRGTDDDPFVHLRLPTEKLISARPHCSGIW